MLDQPADLFAAFSRIQSFGGALDRITHAV